ncbi:FAD-dependent oxidoreductase [Synoicihabitans lomoniglobus]|uniref:FAD-dependent oxidoreductase n=1 Tax=Synoicihabitans lomoniglobus TaxID=2909285 RepID=A0AAE9ZWM9_9BACT|nr:FAD-dependent oxidoreductase [Opitutaceae bacterium LMO-M01]WED64781.1 FAD-dependent oxidoreductase [Opitutaceae bacterium LMO-M01]
MSAIAPLQIVIVGGVAAGASAAARARRLDEFAHITLLERGPDVSFANCGLPYYIGGEIGDRAALAVQTPTTLKQLLNIEVRTSTAAITIDRSNKRVQVQSIADGTIAWLPYDKLVLAPGAQPLRPPLPGIDDPRLHTLRNLGDMDRIKAAATAHVTVIGAGFIGLEMAEQFRHAGKDVTLVELQPQVLPQLDQAMTGLLEDELRRHDITLILGDGIASFHDADGRLGCTLASGRVVTTDLAVLALGVRPDTTLARDAGLVLGPRGHIKVDTFMRTSDPDIYAGGDAVEVEDFVTGEACAVPLGGPANRQGRLAADHIIRPAQTKPFPGVLGTAIVRVFEVTAGLTGWTEKRLKAAHRDYRVVTVNDNHHAGYYPGAQPLQLKLLWAPDSGRILGAQVTGLAGVDKRLDVIATAIMGGLTIDDLAQLELAYAPPFGAAKDIINLAAFTAVNARDGLVTPVDRIPDDPAVQVVDVRPPPLVAAHPLPREGIINIPFGQLRDRAGELDTSRPVVTVCALGKTSYFAARILAQRGFEVRSLTGGIRAHFDPRSPAKLPTP